MGGKFLQLLVLLLAFSQLLSLNAVPVTRTTNLMHELHDHNVIQEDTHLAHMGKNGKVESVIERMNIQLNDYPGPGANNRHTPRRGCIDC